VCPRKGKRVDSRPGKKGFSAVDLTFCISRDGRRRRGGGEENRFAALRQTNLLLLPAFHQQTVSDGANRPLMRLVVANLVLRNANLSNELAAARRTAKTYEEAMAKDLLSLARWLAGKVSNSPGGGEEKMKKSLSSQN